MENNSEFKNYQKQFIDLIQYPDRNLSYLPIKEGISLKRFGTPAGMMNFLDFVGII